MASSIAIRQIAALIVLVLGFCSFIYNLVYSNRALWNLSPNAKPDSSSHFKTVLNMDDLTLSNIQRFPGFKNLRDFVVVTLVALLSILPMIGMIIPTLFLKPPKATFAKIYVFVFAILAVTFTALMGFAMYLKATDLADYIEEHKNKSYIEKEIKFLKISVGVCVFSSLFTLSGVITALCNLPAVKRYYEDVKPHLLQPIHFHQAAPPTQYFQPAAPVYQGFAPQYGQYGAPVYPQVQQYQSANFNQQSAHVTRAQSGGFQAPQAGPAVQHVVQDV